MYVGPAAYYNITVRRAPLLIFLFGLICAAIGGWRYWQSREALPPVCPRSITIEQQKICVEVADTDEKRNLGLSGHAPLGSHEGMLFIFPTPEVHSFWMKEMLFPLDFVWIRDGKVADITQNVPAPDPKTPLSELPHYSPSVPVDQVLEINAGSIEAWGIATGDAVMVQ